MALFVDPGALRAELSLQRCDAGQDSVGGLVETWTETATVFARIEPVAAESVFGADQTLEAVTHRVTLRWRDDVASGMRFLKGNRPFHVVTVHDPDESGCYLVCRVKEVGL
jgi:SPP1 family predicted phage head-tail adaptor